jgi:hypothetical protein
VAGLAGRCAARQRQADTRPTVALDDDGRPLQGTVRTEFIPRKEGARCIPLSGFAVTRSHPTVSIDPADATLTRRRYADSTREPLDSSEWCFATVETGSEDPDSESDGFQGALVAPDRHLFVHEPFKPGWIYELVYTGHSPLVLGLGELVIRDVVAHARSGGVDSSDRPTPFTG